MNSYSIGLSASVWYLVIALAVGIGFSFYIYRRTVPAIPRSRKVLLASLRAIGLGLLLFAVFDPILTMVTGTIEKPKVAVVIDNSLSSGFTDRTGNRAEIIKKALQSSGLASLGAAEADFIIFSDEPHYLSAFGNDSLRFDGGQTDIARAIKYVDRFTANENIRAIVLVSDGAYNTGNNPISTAEALGLPVYSVGIGDTTDPKDVSVQSIITNEIAYIDNPIPVSATISSSGFAGSQIRVTLTDNGARVAEQELSLRSSPQSSSVIFQYMPRQEGVRKLAITAETLSGEQTTINNTASEFVNVLKNKRSVAIFAGAPSPDVSFITNSLSREKGVEVKQYIQKKDGEFYTAPNRQDVLACEMFILVGFPIASSPSATMDVIRDGLESGKPVFFVAAQNTDYEKVKTIQEYLPFTMLSSRNQEFLALPDIRHEAASSSLLRVYGNEKDMELWNKLPPLYHTETFVRPKPETEVISTMKINNAPLKEPLIMTRSFKNSKSVAVTGYGIYRWKLMGYAAEASNDRSDAIDLFDVFFKNAFRWLSVNQNNKNVRIRTNKKLYSNGESVEFLAQVYDAAFNPVDNATVSVKISGAGDGRDLVLNFLSSGRYSARADGLPEGEYYFSGTATVGGNKLGADNGRFSIGAAVAEYQNLKMNSQLLQSLAERTGGRFYLPESVQSLMSDIARHNGWRDRSVTAKTESPLWNYPWMIGLAILMLSIEWFLRKRYAMM